MVSDDQQVCFGRGAICARCPQSVKPPQWAREAGGWTLRTRIVVTEVDAEGVCNAGEGGGREDVNAVLEDTRAGMGAARIWSRVDRPAGRHAGASGRKVSGSTGGRRSETAGLCLWWHAAWMACGEPVSSRSHEACQGGFQGEWKVNSSGQHGVERARSRGARGGDGRGRASP